VPLILILLLFPVAAVAAPSPSTSSPPAGSATSPATNAPAGSATTPATPATNPPGGAPRAATGDGSADRVLLKVPAAGSYLAWVEGRGGAGPTTTPPVSFTGAESSLALPTAPEGLQSWRVYLLDQKTGYSAARDLPAGSKGASELTFAASDFNRVHRVRVQVTGAGGKPIASGTVTLTDKSGAATSRVLDPSAAGTAEFTDIPSGTAKLAVAPTGAGGTTKDVQIALAPGEAAQSLAVALPEVTAVVEGAPAAGPTGSATPGSGNVPATPSQPTSPAPPPSESLPAPGSGSPLTSILGFILLAGAGYGLYVVGRNRGWTLDKGLARLGVQPTEEPHPGPASLRPAAAPAPPVDPNVCQFCGQIKDPTTGACACSLEAAPGAAVPSLFAAAAVPGSGPRLVAMQGAYMGQVFALAGETTIGRDPTNGIAMENDNTVSRRHARLTPADGGYRIEDTGSSNGIYVNGARVTEAVLRPGDDVSIGGTRFRFES
jgi:hypothetical protein